MKLLTTRPSFGSMAGPIRVEDAGYPNREVVLALIVKERFGAPLAFVVAGTKANIDVAP